MERLTQKDEQGNWSLRGVPWEQLHEGQIITNDLYERLYGALWKLMEYEDTGLMPEEVEEIKAGNILNMDDKSILLRQREDGTWEEKPEPYAVIECETEEDFNHIKQRLESTRWIPVDERLPAPNTRVLVTLKHHRWISDYDSVWVPESEKIAYPEYTEVCEAVYMPDIGWKYAETEDDYGEAFAFIEPEEDRSCPVVEVIAWQPLPEPYRKEED